MKVLFSSVFLFLLSFSSVAHFTSAFMWTSNINSVGVANQTNISLEGIDLGFLKNISNLKSSIHFAKNSQVINDFLMILNVKKQKNEQFFDGVAPKFFEITEDLPSSNIGYNKLKQIDFTGHLEVFEPAKLNHSEVMMAISEFKIYSVYNNDLITISLDYLSNQEIRIFSGVGKLMTTIIVGDITKTFVELDTRNFPSGKYFAFDGETRVEFIKK